MLIGIIAWNTLRDAVSHPQRHQTASPWIGCKIANRQRIPGLGVPKIFTMAIRYKTQHPR
jgi:hypothetical protein